MEEDLGQGFGGRAHVLALDSAHAYKDARTTWRERGRKTVREEPRCGLATETNTKLQEEVVGHLSGGRVGGGAGQGGGVPTRLLGSMVID